MYVATYWLFIGGLISGIFAGFLGIGGGSVMVPLLVAFGYTPVNAIATSSLAILMTSVSGTFQNWRMGYLDSKRVLTLGITALLTAQLGAYFADRFPSYLLLFAFGMLMIVNIYLVGLRKHLARSTPTQPDRQSNVTISKIFTGGVAGFVAGLVGVGGGVIMVPLQMLFLGETIKIAIQTSLGVVVLTAISACVGHSLYGNILFNEGLLLGLGGLLGAQISTRFLPKLSDRLVTQMFRFIVALIAGYAFFQAWTIYHT